MSEQPSHLVSSSNSGKDREAILNELRQTFTKHRAAADQKARWSKRWAPILAVIAAVGAAFSGAAVATTGLSTSWKTAVIIVAFFSTGIAAGAAALRPTERAQTAIADLANAEALCAWTEFLELQQQRGRMDDADFDRAVTWLQTWRIHQLRPEPYLYDGRLPWSDPTATATSAPAASASKGRPASRARGVIRRSQ